MAKLPKEAVSLADSAMSVQIWLMTRTLLTEQFGLQCTAKPGSWTPWNYRWTSRGSKSKNSGPIPDTTVKQTRGGLSAKNLSMRQFVEILGYMVDVPLVDKTGFTGVFDVQLEWAPESTSPDPRLAVGADGSGKADIRTALREQLGLRLVPANIPVEVVVVDSVDKPTEN